MDDEEVIRNSATNILKECGYRVILAFDGLEAEEIYKNRHKEINMVLLDMVMPKISGKDTYIKLRAINNEVKVLLSSGFKQDERVQSVMEMGINGFIQKPYTIGGLSQAVNEILIKNR